MRNRRVAATPYPANVEERWPGKRSATRRKKLLREPLVANFLVGTVGLNRFQRGVQFLQQRLVIRAHGNAESGAEVLRVGHFRRGCPQLRVSFQPFVDHRGVAEHAVDTAIFQIDNRILVAVIGDGLHLRMLILQIFLVGGAVFHADPFAFQVIERMERIFFGDHQRRVGVVRVGEGHLLAPLRRNIHSGNHRIIFLELQRVPMDDINLHFTGDMHAITAANNLLSAMIDNHIHQGNELQIDLRQISWTRVLDMNDRALRNVTVALGGKVCGFPREDHFMITVASEIMAVLCLAKDLEDLKARFGRIVVGPNLKGEPVYVHQLGCEGAMALLMKDAIKPNLVQTLEHTPAIVHGGPFANIAHGCNSVVATKLGMKLGDIVVTEAGFGADLGAEKFLDIKCRYGDIFPNAVVIVATLRALKMHGGVSKQELNTENVEAVTKGFSNLRKAIENMRFFGVPVMVAINKFVTDTDAEIAELTRLCNDYGVPVELNECWEKGGEGGIDMAKRVVELVEGSEPTPKFVYELTDSIEDKIGKIVRTIYGGDGVTFGAKAKKQIAQLKEWGLDNLPVCMAKTQYSLSDNPALLGAPTGFTINVTDIRVANGAGFLVCRTGDVMVMPGLPKRPAALNMDIDADGTIKGLF